MSASWYVHNYLNETSFLEPKNVRNNVRKWPNSRIYLKALECLEINREALS